MDIENFVWRLSMKKDIKLLVMLRVRDSGLMVHLAMMQD